MFDIMTGARPGYVLSSFLFLLITNFAMCKAMTNPLFGIKRKNVDKLSGLDFADDIAFLSDAHKKF